MHACTHVRKHACTHARMHACTHARKHACTHASIHACTHASMHACKHARIHACTHARMHACTHARMHACTHPLPVCVCTVCAYTCVTIFNYAEVLVFFRRRLVKFAMCIYTRKPNIADTIYYCKKNNFQSACSL